MIKNLKHIVILMIVILGINIISTKLYLRFDLTSDKRYTLSKSAINVIKDVDSKITIDVLLEGDDFPSEFRRLQTETRQLLEEFFARNNNVRFNFINPIEDTTNRDKEIKQLFEKGLTPMQINVQENGKTSQEIVFPWAIASYKNKAVIIPLIKNKIGASQQEIVTNSVQHLEYTFADGFNKLVNPKHLKIGVLKGNGQLKNKNIASFLSTLRDYYRIAPFTLDSVAYNSKKTLEKIKDYDLIISAKPTQAFSEKEKLVLDQYTMNGGKSLWLIDAVAMEQDSLYNETGKNFATTRDLNLTDFFFKYGARINPVLVNTLYSAPITLAQGEGSETKFAPFNWYYSPLANSQSKHPIVNNLNLVKFDFANQIDTLKNDITKTVLLQSDAYTRLEGTPREINLQIVNKKPKKEAYNKGPQHLAILLEGEFTSVYNHRIKPFSLPEFKNKSPLTKMILIADGDVIKNNMSRKGPEELGFDRWTGKTYGNKEFLLNAVNYLLDDDGLINIRSKEINIAFLDQEKISKTKTKWQLINIGLPLLILGVFALLFNYSRQKKYSK